MNDVMACMAWRGMHGVMAWHGKGIAVVKLQIIESARILLIAGPATRSSDVCHWRCLVHVMYVIIVVGSLMMISIVIVIAAVIVGTVIVAIIIVTVVFVVSDGARCHLLCVVVVSSIAALRRVCFDVIVIVGIFR